MAKGSREKPKTPQDQKSLSAIAQRLEECAASLRAIVALMQDYRIESVLVSHQSSLHRGANWVQSFTDAARKAVYDKMQGRKVFQAGYTGNAAPESAPESTR